MKRTAFGFIALIVTLAGLLSSRAAAQATDWKQIPIPALPAFRPEEPKRIELPNGMIIFLQVDHELPLVNGIARVRGGSIDEPADKAGMLDMYGEVWRTGGTKDQTGDQLDDYLEIRAAKVETNSTNDATSISFSCLKGDLDDVFKLFTALLRQPEFRPEKLDLAQKAMVDAISRRNDEVSEIASRESAKLAYGNDNPYTREPEYTTVAAVTRQDLVDWHHSHVVPNNVILGVLGDFDSAAMEARLRAAFESWPKGTAAKKPQVEFHAEKPGYYLVNKSDVTQSSIRMVELGIRRDNPDYYAAQVFNEAFGGGFSSRLFRSLRTAKGLAYDVGGGIGSAFDHPGIVRLSIGTKSMTTVESINGIYGQIDELATNPISDEEIKRSKDSILNSFVFNLDSPEKVLRERMSYEFYGYPADFLERFRAGVDGVTKEDVQRVVTKYLHKDQLAVLVVGNPADFGQPLEMLGPVTNVDITIPPPPGSQQSAPTKPTASNAEGKALAAKVVQAMGGLDKLQAVKSMRSDLSERESDTEPATPFQVTIVFPDRMHVDVQTPGGKLTIVATPTEGFMAAEGRGVRDMAPPQRAETTQQIHRDLIFIGQHLNDPSFDFFANGTEKVGDVDAQVLDINGADVTMRWFVDPSSGLVLRETYKTVGRSGEVTGETDLENWKDHSGIMLPTIHHNKENGRLSSIVEYKSVEINPTVDPKLFDRPAQTPQK